MFRPISGKAEKGRAKAFLKFVLVPMVLLFSAMYCGSLYFSSKGKEHRSCFNMAGPTTHLDGKWKYVSPYTCL
jgi:hypothetical protein